VPFRSAKELTDFADLVGQWRPPAGMSFCVAIAIEPPGPQASSVLATFDYYGRCGAVEFREPKRAKVVYRMLRDAAAVVIGACSERN